MSKYGIDLEKFSLERFRQTLESGDLLPSRKMLKEHGLPSWKMPVSSICSS